MFKRWGLATMLLAVAALAQGQTPVVSAASQGPARVRIAHQGSSYQLLVNDQTFRIKGAGLSGGGDQEALAARGGNSFRTWRVESDPAAMRAMLDRAQRNGLMVAVGIEVARERHGFDYGDARAVQAQQARIQAEILAYKDHPAVLMWVVGNELNLESTDPRVWNAVGQLADMIHRIDPNHPVMTTLAGFDKPLIDAIKSRAPQLDLIGIQLYGDIVSLPDKLVSSGWTGPYVVTEWGPTGHWESPLTAWQAPIEDTATRKADLLRERYTRYIDSDQVQGLGSYVFLWGHKQERTPTWYGLFLPDGQSTPGVDAMQFLWTGRWPDNRAPSIAPLTVDGQEALASITLAPGSPHRAQATAQDPEGDALDYHWRVLRESEATSVGGDPEAIPAQVPMNFGKTVGGSVRFKAPTAPGHYRLFVQVGDGKGHAAYANLPFRVEGVGK